MNAYEGTIVEREQGLYRRQLLNDAGLADCCPLRGSQPTWFRDPWTPLNYVTETK